MSAHVFVAFWPVVRPETARRDLPWLIREATAALPGVTSAADAVITGTPQWGLMPGHRVPGAAAHVTVLACTAQAECAGRRAYLRDVNARALRIRAEGRAS